MATGFYKGDAQGSLGIVEELDLAKDVPMSPACGRCGYLKGKLSPPVSVEGSGAKGIMILVDSPSWKARSKLEAMLDDAGIDMAEDVWIVPSIACSPPPTKGVTQSKVTYCRPTVWKFINEHKPKMIIPMGSAAITSLLQHRLSLRSGKDSQFGTYRWRGWAIPDQDLKAWVCPTMHPDDATNDDAVERAQKHMGDDLLRALPYLDKPVPDHSVTVESMTDPYVIKKVLQEIIRNPPKSMAFDLETTGIKPHRKGHKIKCIGLSMHHNTAIAFPMMPEIEVLLRALFTDPRIRFIAHNMKFEGCWIREMLGVDVANFTWDTMLAAHCLDNRSGITGLKFQVAVNFGVFNYDESCAKFLWASTEEEDAHGANAINRIDEAPMDDLLGYVGMDAGLTNRLSMVQKRQFGA